MTSRNFGRFFWPPPPSSRFLLQRPHYCRHKIFDPPPFVIYDQSPISNCGFFLLLCLTFVWRLTLINNLLIWKKVRILFFSSMFLLSLFCTFVVQHCLITILELIFVFVNHYLDYYFMRIRCCLVISFVISFVIYL